MLRHLITRTVILGLCLCALPAFAQQTIDNPAPSDETCSNVGLPGLPICDLVLGNTGGGPSASDCRTIRPLGSCPAPVNRWDYHGYCYAAIESCTAPNKCKCDGKGKEPGVKHDTLQ